ncbi:MAG: hypothetical protein KDC38_00250, partial [Planctomycetes bacterium]|nr:hypothetical protein [Planctomycetota bacterium]
YEPLLALMAPRYVTASEKLDPLIDKLQAEFDTSSDPHFEALRDAVTAIRDNMYFLGEMLLVATINDPQVLADLRDALLDLSAELLAGPDADLYVNASEDLLTMAVGVEESYSQALLGLDVPAERDFFLWGLQNRFEPMLQHFARSMSPHNRIHVDLGLYHWFPSTISGIRIKVQDRESGRLLEDRIGPLSDGYSFDIGAHEGRPLRVWFKVPSYVSQIIDIEGTAGGSFVAPPLVQGDTDGNNVIDSVDADNVLADFGEGGHMATYVPPTDVNGDGVVNRIDYRVVKANQGVDGAKLLPPSGVFINPYEGGVPAAAVPAPTGL